MIFAFLCHCCFIELSALLIPKSLERSLVISILKFNLIEKNVLNGDLISGKLCVCQVTRFLVEQTAALGSRREMMANLKNFETELTGAWKHSCESASVLQHNSNCCLHYKAGVDKTLLFLGLLLSSSQVISDICGD